ncbi:MAG: nucleoside phosphorylase [Patescibacteria group bacterium]|nr:nucleoside phosphorylase [Patescibacteria group bacterium]
MKKYKILSHLKIKSEIVPKYILLPGDPSRVDVIGKQLSRFKIVNQNREFRTGIGFYKGIEILVCSTGIGGPSTAIVIEELIDAGATTLIRIGTCGGAWRKDILNGSIIIPEASIRDEGTTLEYVPLGFPAVANVDIISSLKKSVKNNKGKYFSGINRTHDAFYGNQNSIIKWGQYLLDERWRKYDTPIISSEMESSILFVIATLKGVRAGAILLANSNPEPLRERLNEKKQEVKTEINEKKTQNNIENLIKITLEAIKILK